MISFLKYLNSFPLPFTSTHYQVFDSVTNHLKDSKVDSSDSWDTLREEHPHFSIGKTREEWLLAAEGKVKKDGQDGGMIARARDVARVLTTLNTKALFSVGVGGAGLEYQIKKLLPNIHLTCTEYAPKNVEMLRAVFTECEAFEVFDMKTGDWSRALATAPVHDQLCLLYRVDPHFTDVEWRAIFESLHGAGVHNILFIPCICLSVRAWFFRLFRRLLWFIHRTPVAFAGYVRTQKKFETFWKGLYEQEVGVYGGLRGFLLRIDNK